MRAYLFVLISIFSLSSFATETIQLKVPDLSEDNIIGYNVGLRPFRSSGMRIEAQLLDGKTIIHNYGHGGAGISLSWGSAAEAIKIMHENGTQSKDAAIAIIGAGVMGLSVANQLLDLGFKVRVYSDKFEGTTSEVAGGLWDPFGIVVPENGPAREQYDRVWQISHDFFHELATSASPRYKDVSYKDVFVFFNPKEENNPTRELVDCGFSNGVKRQAEKERAMLIETPSYLEQLRKNATSRGAIFIPRRFSNEADVAALSEDVIFNCAGLGSKIIFNDPDLMPIRGQLIYVNKTEGVDYFAAATVKKGSNYFVFTFPYKNKFIIGGTYEKGENVAALTPLKDVLLQSARELFATGSVWRDEL